MGHENLKKPEFCNSYDSLYGEACCDWRGLSYGDGAENIYSISMYINNVYKHDVYTGRVFISTV